MLFDIDKDPHELVDLSEDHPEVVEEGRALLSEWLKEDMNKSLFDEDPLISTLHGSGPYHYARTSTYGLCRDSKEYMGRRKRQGTS